MKVEASRDLDAKIAVLLGYELWKERPGMMWVDGGNIGVNDVPIPSYSFSIGAAWEMVEYMRERGLTVDVSSTPDESKWLQPNENGDKTWSKKPYDEKYQCIICSFDLESDGWFVFCDPLGMTAPLAICSAFLKVTEK